MFKKYLPTRDQLREIRALRFLGEVIFEPNLWHINRYSVSWAVFFGSICCFLPIPFQMIPCLLICVTVRCNVPIAVAIVWISNPITMPPMMYFAYRVGAAILGENSEPVSVEISLQWLASQFAIVWQPLLLGTLVSGFTMGTTGFIVVRLYWRWKISRYWRMRRARMKLPK